MKTGEGIEIFSSLFKSWVQDENVYLLFTRQIGSATLKSWHKGRRAMKKCFVTMHVGLPVKFTPRKRWVLASCPILDVHSQGDTEDEAKENLIEALHLFFLSCLERGTLDDVMRECGFVPTETMPPPEQCRDHSHIDVPIPFNVTQRPREGKPSSCHV